MPDEDEVVKFSSWNVGGRTTLHTEFSCGVDVQITAFGDSMVPIILKVIGSSGLIDLQFRDSFQCFKKALQDFVTSARERTPRISASRMLRVVSLIEMSSCPMRTILLTGAAADWSSVSQALLGLWYIVVAIGRSRDSLDKLKVEFREFSNQLRGLSIDLSSENSSDRIVDFLLAEDLRPNCLINNARNASYLRLSSSGFVSRNNFMGELLMDVVMPYELTTALAQQTNTVLESVVNIGSQYGVAPNLNLYLNQ